jgi:Leucine-rich repeat (LRR) protein
MIPNYLEELANLTELNIESNLINELNVAISQMRLSAFHIGYNSFTSIPHQYRRLILGLDFFSLDWMK